MNELKNDQEVFAVTISSLLSNLGCVAGYTALYIRVVLEFS